MDKFYRNKNNFAFKRAAAVTFACSFLFSAMSGVFALSAGDEVVPLGKTTGIKMYADGAVIVGFSPVSGKTPASDAGLETGDIIVSAGQNKVTTNEDLVETLENMNDPEIQISFERSGEVRTAEITAVFDENVGRYRIGAWVRDSMAGIGTITFVDPESGVFGALGHGVCDIDTGNLMPFESGALMKSSVSAVRKGESGKPGELCGEFNLSSDQGNISANTSSGIYGKLYDDSLYSDIDAVETCKKSEIECGEAKIYANIDGIERKCFDIEIMRVYNDDDGVMRDMMIRVTDPELIAATGGIVQGMSGSPIMQNGKLVGAVTHVLVNDPEKGYGIAIENMLKEAA